MYTPRVNLGQSEFQDTFMVVADEPTPFRKLRKIELHIRELEEAITHNKFNIRRMEIKIKRLTEKLSIGPDEIEAIDLEELEYQLKGSTQLLSDANHRMVNFQTMKQQIIDETPVEYWEAGFENAEMDHWVQFFSRRAALEMVGDGHVSTAMLEQIVRFPDEISTKIMKLIPHKQQKMLELAEITADEVKIINERTPHSLLDNSTDR